MRLFKSLSLKMTILYFCIAFFAFRAIAQKLPDVQKVPMRAPVNMVIDGNAADWGNRFQANNQATSVLYSVANDDNKLYFIIHAETEVIIHKMMRGCVTITINTSGKKTDKGAAAITFPNYVAGTFPNVSISAKPKKIADTMLLKLKTDTFMRKMNKRLADMQKLIAVTGIKQITDTLISVYNDYDIEAKALLDSKLYYNYELAVPLKCLGLSIDNAAKFSYNVRLNGIEPKGSTFQISGTSGFTYVFNDKGQRIATLGRDQRDLTMAYPNDFWGEYTLAKK